MVKRQRTIRKTRRSQKTNFRVSVKTAVTLDVPVLVLSFVSIAVTSLMLGVSVALAGVMIATVAVPQDNIALFRQVTSLSGACSVTSSTRSVSCCLALSPHYTSQRLCQNFAGQDPFERKAADNNQDTLWCSRTSFGPSTPADWVMVDLGAAQPINRITIKQPSTAANSYRNPYACGYATNYVIQVSTTGVRTTTCVDDSNWQTVPNGTGVNDSRLIKDVVLSAPVTGRYVRLCATGVVDNKGWRLGVQEFQVFTNATAPVITTISPTGGAIGATIAIVGRNFTPSGNKVYLNNILLGTYNETTRGQINTGPIPGTVPQGLYQLTVENANGLRSNGVVFQRIAPFLNITARVVSLPSGFSMLNSSIETAAQSMATVTTKTLICSSSSCQEPSGPEYLEVDLGSVVEVSVSMSGYTNCRATASDTAHSFPIGTSYTETIPVDVMSFWSRAVLCQTTEPVDGHSGLMADNVQVRAKNECPGLEGIKVEQLNVNGVNHNVRDQCGMMNAKIKTVAQTIGTYTDIVAKNRLVITSITDVNHPTNVDDCQVATCDQITDPKKMCGHSCQGCHYGGNNRDDTSYSIDFQGVTSAQANAICTRLRENDVIDSAAGDDDACGWHNGNHLHVDTRPDGCIR